MMKLKVPRIVIVDEKAFQDRGDFNLWEPGEAVLLLGEITNMPGHVVVVTQTGKVHWGWDEDNFREATEDEI